MPAVFLVGFVSFSHLYKQFIGGYINDGLNWDMECLPCTGIFLETKSILSGRLEYSLNTGPGPLDVSGNTAPLLWSIRSDQALSNFLEVGFLNIPSEDLTHPFSFFLVNLDLFANSDIPVAPVPCLLSLLSAAP